MIEIEERPLSVCISDDASMLLVGTTTGNVVLFDPRYVLLSYFVAPLGGGYTEQRIIQLTPISIPRLHHYLQNTLIVFQHCIADLQFHTQNIYTSKPHLP